MKKYLGRGLTIAALIALTIGIVFEWETHVVRGWLRGEAVFDGRPTSFWRLRCDEWLERFDDKDSLTQCTWMVAFEIPADPGLRWFGMPKEMNGKGGHMRLPKKT